MLFPDVSYMYYNGDFYLNGTEIELSDKFIEDHEKKTGERLWKYARFYGQTNKNGISYMFTRNKCTFSDLLSMGYRTVEERNDIQDNCKPYFVLSPFELGVAIEKIVKPLKLEREQTEAVLNNIATPKSDWDYPEMCVAWIVYIVVMIGSLIFKQFYIPWIIATIIFVKYRKGIMR